MSTSKQKDNLYKLLIPLMKEMIETAKHIKCERKRFQDTSNMLTEASFLVLLHMKIIRKDLSKESEVDSQL